MHTPGPWRIDRRSSTLVVAENGRYVTSTGGYSSNTDNGEHILENEANAQLCAAAPELLELLEEARGYVRDVPATPDWGLVERINLAISKAKGS